ncbi:S8 family serine peptidase [Reichenbachiella carrageenanivorans]|uniref:S8 family serine peptidase n=1 Tax=Reichenbachiella carrageenanivorans TaxID=2979869 RepID=A0ABY6CW61_9BACT|nr:S8 family serine peptidase [Reichenbachiella carrageenanivorans]UXX78152.1 S8 family serine peptidase [Reichenbachiella carrageenanivorans]
MSDTFMQMSIVTNKILIFWVGAFLLQLFAFASLAQEEYYMVYLKMDMQTAPSTSGRVVSGAQKQLDLNALPKVLAVEPLRYGGQSASSQRTFIQKSRYLDGIYKLKVDTTVDLEVWLREVSANEQVKYAEVEEPVQLLLTPNDPSVPSQDYLTKIKAYDAWNITQGDPSYVIAISDNGTDYDHEDLLGNLSYNVADPVNGIDDDNNGYIDDYVGWDLADEDNDPQGDLSEGDASHGTLVAGIAAAQTNNGVGIAGTGYHSVFYPIKVFRSSNGFSRNAYESIVYAADQGCEVINLSWGVAATSGSQALQDIINYAVLEKNMVVVAAAGNTNADLDFYPASYDHVLSVGMTDINDNKQTHATYSYKIDLMAPGASNYATANNDTYKSGSGSSFAAPQVAGTAALVMDAFPDYSAIQVMEQIRMTSDDIYDVGGNSIYEGKLGKGRLNMYRAVSEKEVASIRSYGYSYSGPFDKLLFRDDTVTVHLNFVNILRPVKNAVVHISSTSPHVEILNHAVALGALETMDSVKNVIVKIRLTSDAPTSEKIGFRMTYTDILGYDDFEYFEFTTAPSYLEMSNQKIAMIVESDGRLGHINDESNQGYGLLYDGQQVARFMGVVMGTSPDSISDNVINDFTAYTYEDDLSAIKNIKFISRDEADLYSLGSLSDAGADKSLGLLIEQEFLIWNEASDADYLVAEYRLTNTTDKSKANMKFGWYMDFNIGDSTKNFVNWEASHQLAYTYSIENPDLLMGVALITNQNVIVNAIDLFDQNELPLDIANTFSDQLKYDMLNTQKTTAGDAAGYDVAQLVTADLGTFAALGSEKIAYALVFATDLATLKANVDKATAKYNAFLNAPPLNLVVGACENEELLLGNEDPIAVYSDALGIDLLMSGTDLNLGSFDHNSTLYFKEITGGYESDVYKMQISIANPQIDFSTSPEILYLGDDPNNEVQFQDLSLGGVVWSWSFDNGSFSLVQNPRISFDAVGNYSIDFTVSTAIGCEESLNRTFVVKQRGVSPVISDQTVCEGAAVSISASNSNSLRFFSSKTSELPFYEGATYDIPALNQSVTYYVSSDADTEESARVPVVLTVDAVHADFEFLPDTLDMSSASLIRVLDKSTGGTEVVWKMNNKITAGSQSFVYDFEGLSSLSIHQQVTSVNGCVSTKYEVVPLQTTSKGGISELDICEWEHVTAKPQFGSHFVFYSDKDKTHILDKGKEAVFGPIRTDTSFFISNITHYLESDLVEFEIDVDEFETQILATPDSLLFDQGRNATFSIDNKEVVSTRWFQDNGLQAFVARPTFSYQQPGDYMLTAISKNKNACADTATLSYKVYQILDAAQHTQSIRLYPNPAAEVLTIHTEALLEDLVIFDAFGRAYTCALQQYAMGLFIEVSHLSHGVYFLQGHSGNNHFSLKFIKQ